MGCEMVVLTVVEWVAKLVLLLVEELELTLVDEWAKH